MRERSSENLYICCIPFFLLFESLLEDLKVSANLLFFILRQHESPRPFYIILLLLLLNIYLLKSMELNEYK